MDRLTDAEYWVLAAAAKPSGFCPSSKTAANTCVTLATSGLLQQSLRDNPVWFITDAGRAVLQETAHDHD